MHRPRVSIMLKGSFDHAQFESVCSALGAHGAIYSSWCSVESKGTNAGAYMHSSSSAETIKALIAQSLDAALIQELDVQVEEPHVANS